MASRRHTIQCPRDRHSSTHQRRSLLSKPSTETHRHLSATHPPKLKYWTNPTEYRKGRARDHGFTARAVGWWKEGGKSGIHGRGRVSGEPRRYLGGSERRAAGRRAGPEPEADASGRGRGRGGRRQGWRAREGHREAGIYSQARELEERRTRGGGSSRELWAAPAPGEEAARVAGGDRARAGAFAPRIAGWIGSVGSGRVGSGGGSVHVPILGTKARRPRQRTEWLQRRSVPLHGGGLAY
jgi:hypothetical protein